MTAITITDLENAKLDVDHIASIATSTAATATDRLGNVKSTIKGATDSLTAKVADVEAYRLTSRGLIDADVADVEARKVTALAIDIPAAIATVAAINNRGAWAATTAYALKDIVLVSGTWYMCVVVHTSSASFATDTASKWRVYQGVIATDLAAPTGSSLVGANAYQNQDDVNNQVFGFKRFGAKLDTRQMLDGSIAAASQIITSATAAFTAADVGKLISIWGAGVGGKTLVGTILSVGSATAVTVSVAATATVTGQTVFVGTDDTIAINVAIAAVKQLTKGEQLMQFGGAALEMEAGNASITSSIYIPLHVNIRGHGAGISMFTCMADGANLSFDDRDGTNGQGGYFDKISVNGNNLTTADLVYIGTRVMMTFDHVAIGYGWGNGLVLVNTQNCQFNLLEIRACGNTTAGTGKLLVLKNGTAGNVFIRPEINEAVQRHISFEDTFNTNTSGNVFIAGLCEYWKGQTDAPPKTNWITEFVYADFRGSGGIGNQFLNFAWSYNGMTAYVNPIIHLAQGGIGPLIFTNPTFDGDPAALATVFKLRSNTGGLSLIEISGSMYVNRFAKLFDTTANTGIEDKSYYFPINVASNYSADDAVLADDRINATFFNRVLSRSGQYGFPAVQVPSTGVNVLDDYREGTYSPTLTFGGASVGITYTLRSGTYVKNGKIVTLNVDMVLSSKGSSMGAAAISLPFTAGAACFAAFGPCRGLTLTAGKYPNGQTVATLGTFGLAQTDYVSGESVLTDASLSVTARIAFTLTYIAQT